MILSNNNISHSVYVYKKHVNKYVVSRGKYVHAYDIPFVHCAALLMGQGIPSIGGPCNNSAKEVLR